MKNSLDLWLAFLSRILAGSKRRCWAPLSLCFLMRVGIILAISANTVLAAHFTDPFASDPSAVDHRPFMWDIAMGRRDAPASWAIVDGTLQYRTKNSHHSEARIDMFTADLNIHDDSAWSLETAFRHISGVAPHFTYESIITARWNSKTPGSISLFSLYYDVATKSLVVGNGDRIEKPIAADMAGRFHQVRVTVQTREVRVYVDRKLAGGPYPLGHLKMEWGPERFYLGPVTGDKQPHSVHCAWDYFSVTEEGAFAPGKGGWNPAAEKKPVWLPNVVSGESVNPAKAFDHPPYEGIRVLPRVSGRARFNQSLPKEVILWNAFNADKPTQLEVPIYRYSDVTGPTMQNFYRDTFPLKLDDRRTVAMLSITRGIDDTAAGFMDYKLWYCVSTDGGKTYDKERPLVQRGTEYSPQHPNRYVWIGKNGFVFATLHPFLVKMSNGQIFLPCFYGPLDEHGQCFNPSGIPCYASVFGLIGTWDDARNDVFWDVTNPFTLPLDKCTGGLSECGVVELRDRPGHIFMAIRAGNEGDKTGRVPCWKWKTLSTDYGKTWSELIPFTFSDGERFWSPTSQAMFIRSSRTGKAYWIGNISRTRPRAGSPRYPLVIAELDEEKLGLRRETVTIIDDRVPGDSADMQLSNFSFIEDPETGHILVTLCRDQGRSSWGPPPNGPGVDGWQTYEIEVR
jgi:hypothetical protein